MGRAPGFLLLGLFIAFQHSRVSAKGMYICELCFALFSPPRLNFVRVYICSFAGILGFGSVCTLRAFMYFSLYIYFEGARIILNQQHQRLLSSSVFWLSSLLT
jgi:hypothetical protein